MVEETGQLQSHAVDHAASPLRKESMESAELRSYRVHWTLASPPFLLTLSFNRMP